MDKVAVADTNRQVEIKPKVSIQGKVIKTTLAGAVVDIGRERPGLLHVSQIVTPSDQPLKSVTDVLKPGDTIEVWIRREKDERIELTMIKPLDLEWREIKKDMVVKGKVVRLEGFGAFVDIGAERPGLIHISELAHGYVRTPSDVVKEGDEVEAMVIEVNRKKKQIKLSLKALQPEPIIEQPERVSEPARREKSAPASRKPKKSPARRRDEGMENIDELMNNINDPAQEAEPTAMEIAIREAMERAKARKQEDKKKKEKSISSEQEDILSRTLETKSGSAS